MFERTAKGIKGNSWGREVLGRVEGGDQRGDCAGEEYRGDYSFQSILHGTQSWKQEVQYLGLQEVKESNSQITFPNVECNISYTNNQTKGQRYLTGTGEGLSSFESERGLAVVQGIHVQKESVLLCGPTFCLDPESTAIQQSNDVNNQGNQGEVQRESGTIHGRPTDLIIGKETAGM
ncbi:MAG: hypothetical protein EZS28_027066 [Streblomastix strix]|uniref:Uncharacterized protein n=1 Tax=Streblomastix strix TaxID=222440 RepID=A0A5J4V386_9EUKA|nr:MAG: hypothetical protein EZS28_027066 [Streblomastix strix]